MKWRVWWVSRIKSQRNLVLLPELRPHLIHELVARGSTRPLWNLITLSSERKKPKQVQKQETKREKHEIIEKQKTKEKQETRTETRNNIETRNETESKPETRNETKRETDTRNETEKQKVKQ